jgi:hypothetical protein
MNCLFDVDGPATAGDVARIRLPLGVFFGVVSVFLVFSKAILKMTPKANNE